MRFEKKRIVLVYPGYPPEEKIGGGISTFAKDAAEALSILGNEVIVISRSDTEILKIENISENLKVYRVPGELRLSSKLKFLSFRKMGAFLYSYKVKNLIDDIEKNIGQVDVIESADWGAEAISLIFKPSLRKKLLVRCHTPSFISEKYNPPGKSYLSFFTKILEKIVLSNVKYIASPSNSLVLSIKKEVNLSKAKIQIQLCPLGIKNVPVKDKYSKDFSLQRPLRILNVGRLEVRKGQDVVCQSMNLLVEKKQPVELFFIGADTSSSRDGSFKKELLGKLTHEAINKVHFIDHIPREDVFGEYPRFDCYILSSRYESLGLVVLEAMRAGLPVIASNMCEMPNIIKDSINGFLYETDNYRKLSEKIMMLVNDPILLESVGLKGGEYFLNNYSKDAPVEKMLLYYEEIMKDGIK